MSGCGNECGCHGGAPVDEDKREFLGFTAAGLAAVGTGAIAWSAVDSMNPAADTLALASTEIDIGALTPGQSLTAVWRGKPVFIHYRTPEQIQSAETAAMSDLKDPQADKDRVQKAQYLVVVGICTHLGCVPLGQKEADPKGDFGGWFCPCHGSHYDTSGRIRKGPAPLNLAVPPYNFISDTVIKIG